MDQWLQWLADWLWGCSPPDYIPIAILQAIVANPRRESKATEISTNLFVLNHPFKGSPWGRKAALLWIFAEPPWFPWKMSKLRMKKFLKRFGFGFPPLSMKMSKLSLKKRFITKFLISFGFGLDPPPLQ